MMALSTKLMAARALSIALGCLMLATLIYTISIDGQPFRKELLTPWMVTTLVDFYINVFVIAVWVAYKESSPFSAFLWIILLVCLGSITTCAYIIIQLFKLSSIGLQDPIYHVLLHSPTRTSLDRKRRFHAVLAARILFSALGCLMLVILVYTLLTYGSPFKREILTPWLAATLVDFYINVVAIAVWITYKETTWMCALVWIILLICFGSIATCAYVVIELLQISSQDPLYLVLFPTGRKPGGWTRDVPEFLEEPNN